MACLLDTNVAIRCVIPNDPQYNMIRGAVLNLISNDQEIVVCAQVLGEAWSLCTRPSKNRGGYGMSPTEADAVISDLLALATLLPEPPDLWREQQRLLMKYEVSGVQTHDARLVAWCNLNRVSVILTLNSKDLVRYGITAIEPEDLEQKRVFKVVAA